MFDKPVGFEREHRPADVLEFTESYRKTGCICLNNRYRVKRVRLHIAYGANRHLSRLENRPKLKEDNDNSEVVRSAVRTCSEHSLLFDTDRVPNEFRAPEANADTVRRFVHRVSPNTAVVR